MNKLQTIRPSLSDLSEPEQLQIHIERRQARLQTGQFKPRRKPKEKNLRNVTQDQLAIMKAKLEELKNA